jgi:hypothetical protein
MAQRLGGVRQPLMFKDEPRALLHHPERFAGTVDVCIDDAENLL